MPKVRQLTLDEARVKTAATGKNAELIKEYTGLLDPLSSSNALAFEAANGEELAAVVKAIKLTARATMRPVVIKQIDGVAYVFTGSAPKRRGRPAREGSRFAGDRP